MTYITVLPCPIPGCGFNTDNVDMIGTAAILNIDANIHSTPPAAHPVHGAPKLEQPKIGFAQENNLQCCLDLCGLTFRIPVNFLKMFCHFLMYI